jgi:hypothetical protein
MLGGSLELMYMAPVDDGFDNTLQSHIMLESVRQTLISHSSRVEKEGLPPQEQEEALELFLGGTGAQEESHKCT